MRRILLLLACLAFAATAQAAPTPLARVDSGTTVALAGDHALFTKIRGTVLSVYAVPVTGGTPTRVFSYTFPADTRPEVSLSGSAQKAAIAVLMDGRDGLEFSQAFAGPLGQPWPPLGPRTRVLRAPNTLSVQVDGDRVFGMELRGSFANWGVTAYDPAPHDVPFYSPIDAPTAVFAGDLVAYSNLAPDDPDPDELSVGGRRLTVRDWRTGGERGTLDFPDRVIPVALRPDGTVLTGGTNAPVQLYTPGHAPQPVTTEPFTTARFAGAQIVVGDHRGPRLGGPGALRRVGPTTETAGSLSSDDRHILWAANGCLLVADVTETTRGPLGPGPCARSELANATRSTSVRLRRTLRVQLRCVSAPVRCRSRVGLGRLSRLTRFAIPVGETRTIKIRLTNAGHTDLELDSGGGRVVEVPIVARTDDGAELADGAHLWVQ